LLFSKVISKTIEHSRNRSMPDKRNMLIIETWAVKFDPERVTHSQRAGKIELNGKVE